MNMLDAALDYASRGWPIFPLTPGTKEPIAGSSGVLDATTNVDTIRRWWSAIPDANIGLDVGGAGMMVLDLDPGHDPAALDAAIGKRPHTGLRQRTPRGGTHEFFALAEGEHVSPSASKVAPSVDVRSFHSYVVLAPSRIEGGGVYEWENDDWPAPRAAYRSDKMVEAANLAREKHKGRDEWIIEADLPENIARYVKWLQEDAKVATEGQGGDHCAYATAAMGKSFGISAATVFDLMVEHWNPRCNPPWGEGELDHLQGKVENAYAYNTSPPGNMTDAYREAKRKQDFQPVERKTETFPGAFWTAGRFRIVDRTAMEEISEPKWLIPGLLPEQAYCLLVGASYSLKTFLALDIALGIASGGRFSADAVDRSETGRNDQSGMGARSNHQSRADGVLENWRRGGSGPVLFAVGEGRAGLRNRVRAWERTYLGEGTMVAPSRFWLLDPVPAIERDGEVEGFIELVKHAHPAPIKLLVIDTVGRAMQGANENDQKDASRFTAAMELITKELGCTVLAIHHSGYGEKRARGSSVFTADPDTVLFAEREGKDLASTLTMQKQKDGKEWDAPKLVRFREVEVGNHKSLVVAPEAQTEPLRASVSRDAAALVGAGGRGRGRPSSLAPEMVDQATMAVLAKVKGKDWSSNALAEAVAAHMGSGVPASTIRNNYMRNYLQCNAKFKSYAAYDAMTKRWRLA